MDQSRLEGWLIEQAYEGMLRAMETGRDSRLRAVQAKTAIAELAESMLGRICKVIGGGTFSRSSPFGYWYQDVRALGFLRPFGVVLRSVVCCLRHGLNRPRRLPGAAPIRKVRDAAGRERGGSSARHRASATAVAG